MFESIHQQTIAVIGLITLLSNFITMFLPTKCGIPFFDFILRILNICAGNIAKNRNSDDVD